MVPAHLRETLHDLLGVEGLPPALRDAIQQIRRTSEGYSLEEETDRGTTNTETHDNETANENDEKTNDHDEEYISRQTLSEIAKWARSERGLASLKAKNLGMLAPSGPCEG